MPSSSHASDFDSDSPRFSDASVSVSDWPAEPRLRGLRWRVLLGVLPPCPAPIESLRRAAANGRRRYAELRRRLIVDPHAMEDMQKGENLSVDNPLSQDPESIWGRYFKNAEIERTIESDLTRLYPENGSFFQSFVCQAMLRRILLVWALIHPQYGYRQGMHEVLAPLVYVLHMDVTHLSQVRQRYEDPFEGRFDTPLEDNISFGREGRQVVPSFSSRSARRISNESTFSGDEDWIDRVHPEDSALVEPDDFGFNLKTMVLGSDSYGAEGELGALLSGRFVEHDAYCMFDALLRGQGGAIVLADYFTAVHEVGTGLSPVLEASTAMYHTLAAVDMPLYIHLVGLGVEPQFFALRWLRVLFGREFDLEKLLLLWDAIFAASYSNVSDGESKQMSDVSTSSPQGSFISNFAVSMILYLRPTLLAAPNVTGCLQKLLNFPKNVDIRNFIENAKVLQMHPEESLRTLSSPVVKYSRFFERSRGSRHKNGSCSPSFQAHIPAPSKVLQHRHSGSPEMIRPSFPESYWEERWMKSVLPKVVPEVLCGVSNVDTGATPSGSESSNVPGSNISQVTLVRVASRDNKSTQSAQSNGPSPVHNMDVTNRSTRHNLLTGILEEAAHLMGFENRRGDAYVSSSESKPASPVKASSKGGFINVTQSQVNTTCSAQLTEGNEGPSVGIASAEGSSEVAISDFWTSDDGETSCSGDEGGKSRICYCTLDRSTDTIIDKPPSHEPEALECLRSSCNSGSHEESQQNSVRRHRIGKLSDSTGKEVNVDIATMNDLKNSDGTSKVTKEKHSRAALQTLGHSMVESIQVLESALSSLSKEGAPTVYRETAENISKAFLNGKGHVTALSALSELRKISSILLQM